MPDLKTGTSGVQTLLVCRLRHKQLTRGKSPTAGEIELENTSPNVIEIETRMHALQYLNLIVTDMGGRVLSEGHYGDNFSPRGRIDALRLAPGEKYIHIVSLLNTLPPEKQLPGTYRVHAVYEYQELKAVSEPLLVQLPEKGS